MSRRPISSPKKRDANRRNTSVMAARWRRGLPHVKGVRAGLKETKGPFFPPEDWHEPSGETGSDFKILVQPAGDGFRHVLTPDEIRERLLQMPPQVAEALDVVQLSTVTLKKRRFPCYGMQWGTTIYLYPIEESRVEVFGRPPRPAEYNEAKMFGGRWHEMPNGCWKLTWTEAAIKDYYLNNILIHELGHLLDDRNTSYEDRERFANWFAVEFGYRSSRRAETPRGSAKRAVRRRHHRKT